MPTTRSPSTCCAASVTMPAGLVKLISHAFGRSFGDRLGELDHRRDRAEREADPAGAGRLLPEHADRERDRLVDHPALEPADADRGEDEVGALDRVVEVGRGPERQLLAALLGEPVQDGRHPLHPALVEIVQHDLVEREALALGQQRPVDERDAEPSSADDRELHWPKTVPRHDIDGCELARRWVGIDSQNSRLTLSKS